MAAHAVVAPSGRGKSTAIYPPETKNNPTPIGLSPKYTFLITPDMKPLPFRGWQKLFPQIHGSDGVIDLYSSRRYSHDTFQGIQRNATNPAVVLSIMQAMESFMVDPADPSKGYLYHVGVIDTVNHIMTHQFLKKAKSLGYEKFTEIGNEVYDLIKHAQTSRIEWFFLFHSDDDRDVEGNRLLKIKTVGKLLDEKVDLASMFTCVFGHYIEKVVGGKAGEMEFGFLTQTDGTTPYKTPYGMFPELKIPNDLGYVLRHISAYNQGKPVNLTVTKPAPEAAPVADAEASAATT